ncbi:hypothetical protein GCM10010969_18230 [Saccharibacillus kuerlensis]|uniref:Uncharacterized protein n=1 Tax=Saccharibacillus kuerlensis TaxID=459527 RepID=A0ABQ2L1A8_9BACL|nr:hypothetical protein GCM10010969_18230 [Saccharibacillus kuerlensis]
METQIEIQTETKDRDICSKECAVRKRAACRAMNMEDWLDGRVIKRIFGQMKVCDQFKEVHLCQNGQKWRFIC